MEKFREKLVSVRAEVDAANERADAAEAEVKRLKDEQTSQDHEITSLKNRLQLAEEAVDAAEGRITEAKLNLDEGETTKIVGEGLMRKVTLLETQLDSAERGLAVATEELRRMETRTEHFESMVQKLEEERSNYEAQVEELTAKYNTAQEELNATLKSLDDM